ncbi:DIL domain-containing protein [Cunninghamella echinulata]|nr:DIL domain-containing protein [Cunninghamella echinulata]
MWAIANNHHSVAKLLLNQGASSTIKTTIGRTILDFIDYNNQEVVQILSPYYSTIKNNENDNDDEQKQQQEFHKRIQQKQQRNAITTKLNDLRLYYQSIEHEHDNEEVEEEKEDDDDDDKEEEKDDLHNIVLCETSMESVRHFIWDKCLPDQMFVFAEEDIPHILEIIILDLQLPMKSRQETWVPSNVLFLCARFAHYFSSHDLLQSLLSEAISCIEDTLQKNKGDIHTLAFWIANLSQLLYYLKKDTGLVVATAVQQLEISELISETYVLLIVDSEKRMDKILEPSILDYGSNDSESIEFADDWQRFFRRRHSSRRQSSLMSTQSSSSSAHSPSNNNNYTDNIPSLAQVAQEYQQSDTTTSPFHHYRLSTDTTYSSFQQQQQPVPSSPSSLFSASSCTLSPHSITSLLSSILYVLQSYEVHPDIIKQAFSQFFHFMSSHLFNQILDNKKYMCRSKAMDIRMNMCTIENWVRDQQELFHPLISYFMPLIQLLQLLQCISHIDDLDTFKNTLTMFELLNPLQIKRCVLYYRYEVDERRLPDDIEKYVTQLAKHTLNQQQQQHRRASQPPPFHQNNNKKQQSSTTSSSSLSRCNSSPINNIKSSEANNYHDDEFHASSPQSNASSRRQSHVSSRPTSVSSLGSLIMSKLTGTASSSSSSSSFMDDEKEGNNSIKEENTSSNNDGDDNESFTLMHHDDIMEEKRDLKYMLPFSLPASSTMVHYQSLSSTTTSMQRQSSKKTLIPTTATLHEVSEKIYKEVRQKLNANENEKIIKERIIIPTIPQEWMDKLDRRHESYSSSTIIKERTAMEVY